MYIAPRDVDCILQNRKGEPAVKRIDFINKNNKRRLRMTREEFNSRITELLTSAVALIPTAALPDLPFMKQAPTVPDWYDFEHRLWELGEDIRQLTVAENKELNAEHVEAICRICTDPKAKRGRQSFVMLMGKKRYSAYADRLATLLTDEDVCGHVISTLCKMGASQYAEEIKPYTTHPIAWIRNEAKKYLTKYSVSPQ